MKRLSNLYIRLSRLFLLNLLTLLILGCAPSEDMSADADKVTKPSENTNSPYKKHQLSKASEKQLLADMVWVEGGSFLMGSDAPTARNRENTVHTVNLDGFYIGKTEVQALLWEEIMGWNTAYFTCDTCPINNISWFNVQVFIERLNNATGLKFRLPTEAEWEYAAKGGQQSKGFIYSGSNNIADVAWYQANSKNKSHPVALKQPNELGLYDMTGNLWEFCQDDMERNTYSKQPRTNPLFLRSTDPKHKTMKVIRGSGYEFGPDESEVYRRDGATNNVRMPDIGFRLALSKK